MGMKKRPVRGTIVASQSHHSIITALRRNNGNLPVMDLITPVSMSDCRISSAGVKKSSCSSSSVT